MFTGIVQDIGCVRAIDKTSGDWRVEIATAMDLSQTAIGASICCSGCCLTVVEKDAGGFAVVASAETLLKTTIKHWVEGTEINLEPSLRLGDELGGHLVFGHVDGVATLRRAESDHNSHRLTFTVSAELLPMIAAKGSVTLDGVSLTVNHVFPDGFDAMIIPHTAAHTTLGHKKPDDLVNIEVDMLARYVARRLEAVA